MCSESYLCNHLYCSVSSLYVAPFTVVIHSITIKSTLDVWQGILAVREEVCEFLHERDGYPANAQDIFLTNGASEGVRLCMQVRPPDRQLVDPVC